MQQTLRKEFNFGKVDYLNHNRKDCLVTVEMELRIDTDNNRECLSICGEIWNPRHTNIYCGGQCLGTILEFINDETFFEIYRLWKLYHLNDFHAGTPRQERAIKEWEKNHKYDYSEACEYLKSVNLYEDGGYKYGHGWLYEPIPENDLKRIHELLEA